MPTDADHPTAPGADEPGVAAAPGSASAAPPDPRVADALLGVADVQALLEVKSRATVVNWIKARRFPAMLEDGKYAIRWGDLSVAPLLKRKAVLARRDVQEAGIAESELSQAIADRVIFPSEGGLFSLDDVSRLIAHSKSELVVALVEKELPVEPEAPTAPTRTQAVTPIVRGPKSWHERQAYLLEHADPARLSDEFWGAYTEPPKFISPAGVFLYRFIGEPFVYQGRLYTAVSRSAGWQRASDGSAVAVPWKERYRMVEGVHFQDEDPVPFLTANARYREWERAWDHAWRAHCARTGRPLKGDDGRRDRRALLNRYLVEGWSPSDLPPSFWGVPEEPPFVAPLGEATYFWGELYMKPWPDGFSYPFTKVMRSEMWAPGNDGEPVLLPPAKVDEVAGSYAGDDPLPEVWAAANRRCEWARTEWSQCYQLFGPRAASATTSTTRAEEVTEGAADSTPDPPAVGPLRH